MSSPTLETPFVHSAAAAAAAATAPSPVCADDALRQWLTNQVTKPWMQLRGWARRALRGLW
jgi:hypothetical protein